MSASYLEARGKITAHHYVQFERTYQKKQNSSCFTDVKEYITPTIIGIDIPLPTEGSDMSFSFSEFVILKNDKLPFGITYRTCATENEKETECTLLHAVDGYINDYYHSFANTNVLDCDMEITASSDGYRISADMSCIDFMGLKSEICVEE